MIDQDLLAYVSALGTPAADRVFFGIADQSTPFPYIVIVRRGGSQPLALSGQPLFPRVSFEINVFTESLSDAYPISQTLVQSLHGFSGTLGSTRVIFARCSQMPDHVATQDGDTITRWVTTAFDFMHAAHAEG